MSATGIDEAKLEQFMGQFVGDLGAAMTAPLVVIGDKLGLYKAMADERARHPRGSSPSAPAPPSATSASGSPAGRQRLRRVRRRRTAPSVCRPSRRWRWPTKTARRSSPAPSSSSRPIVKDEPQIDRRASAPATASAGTSTTMTCSRAPSASSGPATRANLVDDWLPALDGVGREARARREGRRRRLRARRLDDPHGQGLPDSRRSSASTTTSPSIEPARAAAKRGRRRRPRAASRSPRPRTSPGAGYDLVCVFDCLHDMGDPVGAARHVREALAAGRHLAGRRAVRRRQRRGEPEPGRPDLLRGLDDDLHAGVAEPGGRAGARRPGRRAAPPRGPRRRRLQPCPPRDRDAVQHRSGGEDRDLRERPVESPA